eukprot:3467932-Lingulodinium_polyedra.AAC.1
MVAIAARRRADSLRPTGRPMQVQLPGVDVFTGVEDNFDSGTDSDTASSIGEREYGFQDISHLDPTHQEQE